MKRLSPTVLVVIGIIILFVVLPLGYLILAHHSQNQQTAGSNIAPNMPTPGNGLLPGQQIWKNGVSSYIFGTNDTGEWSTPNIEFSNVQTAPGAPNTVAQNLVKQSGFTLMRSFMAHHELSTGKEMTDAGIQARLNTIANTGEQCLGILVEINPAASSQHSGDKYTDLQFAEHVVTLSDGTHPGYARCRMFEIGNESNINGYTMPAYLSSWNIFVTALKRIRPDITVIGPVMGDTDVQPFLQGIVKNNYPRPDAISWHWYPCGYGSTTNWINCMAQISTIGTQATEVRGYEQSILGYTVPTGISEWSADPSSGGNMALDEPQMSQFITQALNAMMAAKLDFANEFTLQSYAAYGGLDMLDSNNTPRPYFHAFVNVIAQYKP
jgi:hypothetical protein